MQPHPGVFHFENVLLLGMLSSKHCMFIDEPALQCRVPEASQSQEMQDDGCGNLSRTHEGLLGDARFADVGMSDGNRIPTAEYQHLSTNI